MYNRTDWKNREVEFPKRYILTENGDGTHTLQKSPGEVRQEGTPLSAGNLNNLESGVDAVSILAALLYSMFSTSAEGTDQAMATAQSAAEKADTAAKNADAAAKAADKAAGGAESAAKTAGGAAGSASSAAGEARKAAEAANTAAAGANTQAAHLQNMVVQAATREYGSGSTASLTDDGEKKVLSLGLERGMPGRDGAKGDKGDKGDTGPAGVTFQLSGTVLTITTV